MTIICNNKLHVDGSTVYYQDEEGFCHQSFGVGGYLVKESSKPIKFSRSLTGSPFPDCFEHYAILYGMLWLLSQNINTVIIYTDSVECVKLFNNLKHGISKKDIYFLSIYYTLSLFFEHVVIEYHNRNKTDLAHIMSRVYLEMTPKTKKIITNPDKELKKHLESRYSNDNAIKSSLTDFHKNIFQKKF